MKKKNIILSLFIFSFLLLAGQMIYLNSLDDPTVEKKRIEFVSIIGLPDLAISTEASFTRHRTLADTYNLFSDGPEHLEYFPSTFAISYSNLKGK
jgi:hypothetical protein